MMWIRLTLIYFCSDYTWATTNRFIEWLQERPTGHQLQWHGWCKSEVLIVSSEVPGMYEHICNFPGTDPMIGCFQPGIVIAT